MKKTLILLSFILAFALTAQAQITLPVTDNFTSAGADLSWDDYDSSYEVVESFAPSAPGGDGYIMNVNDGSGWQKIHLTDDDGSLGNYKITAYIYMASSDGTNWGRIGIFGRAQSIGYLSDCYYIFADTDGDDYLRVGRYYDGNHASWENYIDPPGSITRDAWHKFELTLSGSRIAAEIDDVEKYSGMDATHWSAGYFGILNRLATTSAPVTRCDRITIEEDTSDVSDWSVY